MAIRFFRNIDDYGVLKGDDLLLYEMQVVADSSSALLFFKGRRSFFHGGCNNASCFSNYFAKRSDSKKVPGCIKTIIT